MAYDYKPISLDLDRKTVREMENGSIRDFLIRHAKYLEGRVLDYGCGRQPYRDLISGEYVPYDIPTTREDGTLVVYDKPEGNFDTVILTQVLPCAKDPIQVLREVFPLADVLLATYPVLWEEYGTDDYWRLTRSSMEEHLRDTGYVNVVHEERWHIDAKDFKLVGGYGVLARKR